MCSLCGVWPPGVRRLQALPQKGRDEVRGGHMRRCSPPSGRVCLQLLADALSGRGGVLRRGQQQSDRECWRRSSGSLGVY